MKDAREIGIVKWFNDGKGYGFIRRANGRDLFVHYSDIGAEHGAYRTLAEGAQVEFSVSETPKGPAATNVRVISRPVAGQ